MRKSSLIGALLKGSPSTFCLVHHVGEAPAGSSKPVRANYSTESGLLAAQEAGVLTFDGVSRTVWDNAHLLDGSPFLAFVIGDLAGLDNSRLDPGFPVEGFCDWSQLLDLQGMGAILCWHTRTHRDLTKLTDDEVRMELDAPEVFDRTFIAWPYGRHDARVDAIADGMGYSFGFGSGGGRWGHGRGRV